MISSSLPGQVNLESFVMEAIITNNIVKAMQLIFKKETVLVGCPSRLRLYAASTDGLHGDDDPAHHDVLPAPCKAA